MSGSRRLQHDARTSAGALFAIALAAAAPGCSAHDPSAVATATAEDLAGPQQITISLPAGVGLHTLALDAFDAIDLEPGASIVAPPAAFAAIANVGTGSTRLQPSALTGDVFSQAAVTLQPHAEVHGSIKSGATVALAPHALVTGTIDQGAALTPLQTLSWTATFAASAGDRTIAGGQTQALAPGGYGDVRALPHSTLRLSSGAYFLNSLTSDPQATIAADTQAGPVFIYVAAALTLQSPIDAGGHESSVMFVYLGTGTVAVKAPLAATFVAPSGVIDLHPSGSQGVRGSFFAKQIRVGPHVTVSFEAFASWDRLFPPTPIVECATFFDPSHENAVFGYTNPLDVAVTIPVGPRNQLDPPSTPPPQPTSFLPGTHHDVFLAGFGGDHLTWSIGGQLGAADQGTKHCALEDYASTPGTPQLAPEGSSPPGSPFLAGIAPDQEVGLRFESAPLPWGTSSALVAGAAGRSGATAPRPRSPGDPVFQVVIDGQELGSDAICGPNQLRVNVNVDGVDLGSRELPGCTNGIACGVPIPNELFQADVDRKKTSVPVTIDVFEVDTALCGGGDDHEFTLQLNVDNGTGLVTGGVTTYDPPSSTFFNGAMNCNTENCCFQGGDDGYGICWTIQPNGKPRVCTAWNAQYIDAGFGEDFASGPGVQTLPASFARARLTLSHGGTSTVAIAPLDQDGCVPFDQTPELGQLLLPKPGADFSLKMELTSQLCLDPAGLGCAGPSDEVTGARFGVTRNGETGPATLCTVLTQDESLQDPSCQVIKQSQGAFGQWIGALPPNPLNVINPTQTDVTRVAATMSQLLRREVDTNGGMSIKRALIDQAAANPTHVANPGEIDAVTQKVCPGVNDTCADDPIDYRGQVGCEDGQPPQNCRLADDRWKMTIAHEIGHVIQRRASGVWNAVYQFNGENDVPGAPPLCRCDHVAIANGWHCLQSLERPSAAQVEGYAQYFASKAWNDPAQNDCTFVYYKEFLSPQCLPGVDPASCTADPNHPGLVINAPPMAFDCLSPTRWRNNHCLTNPVQPGDVQADMGVELDWMGFYYASTRPGPDFVLSSNNLLDLYRATCTHGSGFCNGAEVSWEDCPACSPSARGIHTELVELQQAGNVSLQLLQAFEKIGDRYGVSRSTAP